MESGSQQSLVYQYAYLHWLSITTTDFTGSPKINLDESTPQSQQKQRPRKHRLVRRPSSELASALQSDHKLPLLAISTKGQILPPVANTVAPVGNGSVAVALSLRNVAETEEGEDDDNWDVDFEEGIPISKIIGQYITPVIPRPRSINEAELH